MNIAFGMGIVIGAVEDYHPTGIIIAGALAAAAGPFYEGWGMKAELAHPLGWDGGRFAVCQAGLTSACYDCCVTFG